MVSLILNGMALPFTYGARPVQNHSMTSLLSVLILTAGVIPPDVPTSLKDKGLHELGAYRLLEKLTSQVGPRLSGSPNAAKAVDWGEASLKSVGADKTWKIPCMVPHWVRGDVEETALITGSGTEKLTCCALGMSVGTEGITAPVIEVKSLAEAGKLGERAKGKLVFYNGPFDASLVNTFSAYGRASGQRFAGAAVASKVGAVGVLVRSMTLDHDDVPHTGTLRYEPGIEPIPAAALSLVAADRLHQALIEGPVTVSLKLSCRILPDEPSFNVVGQITGSERPNEIVLMGGHLDSWDKGRGAHDDGAGVCQSLEALRLLQALGVKPKRTIRVVLFMNEENGGRGASAYAAYASNKQTGGKHLAAIESDSGGFAPLGFGTSLKPKELRKLDAVMPALRDLGALQITPGGEGGADIGPLESLGTKLFGLEVESQRYFDYHHSDKDTLDKVNPRELELGAICMANLAWHLAQGGT